MAIFAVANSTVGGFGSSQAAMAATYKTLCGVCASTTGQSNNGGMMRRGKVFDILVGTNGTPADNYMEWVVQRATISTTNPVSAGAISSVSSAFCLDPADLYIAGFAFVNSSNEGQVSLVAAPNLWYVGVNQRASYRWVSAPGAELVYPAQSSATAGNGLVLQGRSGAYTGTATGTVMLSEG